MKEIIRRFEQLLWEEDAPTKGFAFELYQALEPADACETWYWKDIDYFDQTRSFWRAKRHFDRILSILKGFGKSRLVEDCAYTKKMIGALNYSYSPLGGLERGGCGVAHISRNKRGMLLLF